jgi:hypothetical protein
MRTVHAAIWLRVLDPSLVRMCCTWVLRGATSVEVIEAVAA